MTETELMDISKEIGEEWRGLGARLLIMDIDLTNIQTQYETKPFEQRVFRMLMLWKQKYPKKFRRTILITALKDEGRNDLANKLKAVDDEKKRKAKTAVPDSQSQTNLISKSTKKLMTLNRTVHAIKEHTAAITSIAFSHNGLFFATTSLDSYVKVWQQNSDSQYEHGLYEISMKQIYNWNSTYKCLFNKTDDYILVAGADTVVILKLGVGLPILQRATNHFCITYGSWFEDMFLTGILDHTNCNNRCNHVLCSCMTATAYPHMQSANRLPPRNDLCDKTCEKILYLNYLEPTNKQPIRIYKSRDGIRLAKIVPIKLSKNNEALLVCEANNSLYVRKLILNNGKLQYESSREFNLASYGSEYPLKYPPSISAGQVRHEVDHRSVVDQPAVVPPPSNPRMGLHSPYVYTLPPSARTNNEFLDVISFVHQPLSTRASY